jgi:hypothetical protein
MKAAKIDIAHLSSIVKEFLPIVLLGCYSWGSCWGAVSLPFSDGLILGPTETD